jgi:hypothetical protein
MILFFCNKLLYKRGLKGCKTSDLFTSKGENLKEKLKRENLKEKRKLKEKT